MNETSIGSIANLSYSIDNSSSEMEQFEPESFIDNIAFIILVACLSILFAICFKNLQKYIRKRFGNRQLNDPPINRDENPYVPDLE